ncbi:MAG: hypothetical protein WBZ48_07655 [Bacteroidota bacterium]
MKVPFIYYLANSSYAIPAIAGIVRYKRMGKAMRIFLLFCLLGCLDISAEIMLGKKNINNAFLSNYFVLAESAFIFTVYFFSIKSQRARQIISALAFLFLSIWIVDKIYFEVPDQINAEMAIASRIFIIVISVFMMHAVVRRIDHQLTDEPMFWISSSTLIYSAGVFLLIGLSNELLKMGTTYFQAAWSINWSLIIISNIMYTKGFFCTAKYQISFGS